MDIGLIMKCNCLPTCYMVDYDVTATSNIDRWDYLKITNISTNKYVTIKYNLCTLKNICILYYPFRMFTHFYAYTLRLSQFLIFGKYVCIVQLHRTIFSNISVLNTTNGVSCGNINFCFSIGNTTFCANNYLVHFSGDFYGNKLYL